MVARTGQQYLDGLDDGREIWLGSKKVKVTEEAAFKGSLEGMAGYFDWQHKHADECLMEDPETGQQMSASLIIPRNQEDLQKRKRALSRLVRYSWGMLGRTPDYCNVSLAGQVARPDIWERGGAAKEHDNLKRFYREAIEGDLSLTHTIIHAAIDKSVGELSGMNADMTLKVVDRTSNGLIVRGAKVLATLGPFADEIFVYPAHPMQPGFEDYAISFSIPVNTKGVIQLCRDHYGVNASVEDSPFSSRFDEQDAFVIFDDVEVPWERVFMDGQLDVYNALIPQVFPGNVLHQTAIRAEAKLEFAYSLLTEMMLVTGSDKRPEIALMLGEIQTYLTITRSTIIGAEARAYDWGAGAFLPHEDIAVLRNVMPGWMARINEVIQLVGSHHLLATPSAEAFDNPEMGALLERYLPGANGISARERARIMRTAWDFAGSALGSRVELYERFYVSSAARNMILEHHVAQQKGSWNQVKEFLKESGISPLSE